MHFKSALLMVLTNANNYFN